MSEKKLSLKIESRAAATRPLLASTDKVKKKRKKSEMAAKSVAKLCHLALEPKVQLF